jgi:palmitoyltransferase
VSRRDQYALKRLEEATEFECRVCQSRIGPSSKHCSHCNKCVEGFDHHCEWLNNCIGSTNYWLFFQIIVAYSIQACFLIIWLSLELTSKLPVRRSWPRWVNLAISVFYGCRLTMTLQLVSLHLYLQCKGITTYDFILESRNQ